MKSNTFQILLLFAAFLLVQACATSPTVLDEQYKSIHISLFDNRTLEYGVEERFTRSMINAFQRDGRLRIKPKSSADLEMDTTIQTIRIRPLAFSDFDRAVGFGMNVTVSVTVTDTRSGKTIMKDVPFHGSGNFFLQSEPAQTRSEDVAMAISEDVLSRLLEGW